MNQLKLLGRRRFAALFWTQFLGAFNDNFFKNALIILITYRAATLWGLSAGSLVAFASGLFILPFFLFSAFAGQLADKYPKQRIIRAVKLAEVAIMAIGAYGFIAEDLRALFGALALMGLHSTFFGPVKYSILPQLVEEQELVGGNALVEMGTFLAILLGTIAGGLLIAASPQGVFGIGALRGPNLVAVGTCLVALAGYVTSRAVPELTPQAPELRIVWNPITPALDTYRATRENRAVFLSVLGISWFWFYGVTLLTILPPYTKDVLHGSEHVVTLFIALFCSGIALGSMLCERLSDRKLELGLVPFGSIGMTLFALDLFLVGQPHAHSDALMGVRAFVGSPSSVRIIVDLALISVFGGFFTVPLYTLMQQRSEPSRRSRVVAGNNILNALFMVTSAVLLMVLQGLHLTVPQLFGALGLLNAVVAIYIYRLLPEFLLRFAAWIVCNLMYRVRAIDRERIPLDGPAVLVCNHVSFVDWFIVFSAIQRPVRFVVYYKFMKLPLANLLMRGAKVIPIAPAKEDKATLDAAYERIAQDLREGELICVFPEGEITHDGQLRPFKPGIERIVQRTPVPVIPMALRGLWGSFFSRKHGSAFSRPLPHLLKRLRNPWPKVELAIGEPVAPEGVTAQGIADRVAALAVLEPPSDDFSSK